MTEPEDKKYATTPIKLEPWENEQSQRMAARRASVAYALRTLTESLDENYFESWAWWKEVSKKYNLDPKKEYVVRNEEIQEVQRPWAKSSPP